MMHQLILNVDCHFKQNLISKEKSTESKTVESHKNYLFQTPMFSIYSSSNSWYTLQSDYIVLLNIHIIKLIIKLKLGYANVSLI